MDMISLSNFIVLTSRRDSIVQPFIKCTPTKSFINESLHLSKMSKVECIDQQVNKLKNNDFLGD